MTSQHSFFMKYDKILDKIFRSRRTTVVFFCIVFVTLAAVVRLSTSPAGFPNHTVFSVKEGTSLSELAVKLEQARIVRSAFMYKVLVVFMKGSKSIMAGDYLFETPQSALKVAYRTVKGDRGMPQIKITIPEGMASYDMARLLASKIPGFDGSLFLALAKPAEGRLFPDTYYFYKTTTPEEVVKMMTENFAKKTRSLSLAVELFDRPFDDVLKMASIIEREAPGSEDRRIIAGILWKRMDNDHPLQVDQPFFYYLGKTSSELTVNDLKKDTPFNLYVNKGLPPTPTSNPGLGAILDTINPTKTDYWFYLSDTGGKMHYAVDHESHLANKQKYIQ